MTRASTPTLLALDRYAQIMGIDPAHFSGAYVSSPTFFPYGSCRDIWYQYAWQSGDQVSREELAQVIADCETEIANVVGYWPAPTWTEEEQHKYPRPYPKEYFGWMRDVRGLYKSITLEKGKFIHPGKRVTTLIHPATAGDVVYADLDADGFSETCTITVPTSLTDVNEIKLYYAGYTSPEWEIRPVIYKSIALGTVSIQVRTWQMIDYFLHEAYPTTTGGLDAIDLANPVNLMTSVDVVREYTDTTQSSADFYWEPDPYCVCCAGIGCSVCAHATETGCLFARDFENGIACPKLASYSATTGLWADTTCDECREPDIVKVHYLSGDIDKRYTSGETFDPLSNFWATTIAHMATARLEKKFCGCGALSGLQESLREDLAISAGGGQSRFVTRYVMESPFGSRRGEVEAWMRISRAIKRRGKVAVI